MIRCCSSSTGTLEGYDAAFPRLEEPEVCWSFRPPENVEGAGKTGCALHPRSRVQSAQQNAHEHTGSAGASRPSLRSGFTAYFVLSAVNGSFATVVPEKLASQE